MRWAAASLKCVIFLFLDRLSERQRDDADYHRAGGDQAPRGVSLGEQSRSHGGPDQDGDLPRGGHVADRGEDECHKDQDVGERAEDGHPDYLRLVGAPQDTGLLSAGHRDRDQQQRHDEDRGPALQEGWDQERADRLLVPDGVRRDKHAGQKTVDDAGPETRTETPRFARQHEDAGCDQTYPDKHEQRRPLTEQNDGRRCREQRPCATGQRIDEREISDRVSPLQQNKVAEMQNTAPYHEKELHGAQMRRADEHDDDRERDADHKRAESEEPDEDSTPVPDPLGEQVPGRMKDGRRQNQRQREEGHGIVALPVAAEVPETKITFKPLTPTYVPYLSPVPNCTKPTQATRTNPVSISIMITPLWSVPTGIYHVLAGTCWASRFQHVSLLFPLIAALGLRRHAGRSGLQNRPWAA